ncbi:hypothetical protein TNCV_2290241 [Trichonephila clavipes]|uniref:Uncharacterized protein n=1 Tax=Trichonephila clavipes TaxID=2585209 RepID=A0A8X6RTC7_TRICX|nr:hypothetical protein TNCV_2290241 [Trichonephila clavipes]
MSPFSAYVKFAIVDVSTTVNGAFPIELHHVDRGTSTNSPLGISLELEWQFFPTNPRRERVVPVQLNYKWVRDQKSILLAGASQIEEYSDDLRTVAVRQGNCAEFSGPSFIPSNIGRVDNERTGYHDDEHTGYRDDERARSVGSMVGGCEGLIPISIILLGSLGPKKANSFQPNPEAKRGYAN